MKSEWRPTSAVNPFTSFIFWTKLGMGGLNRRSYEYAVYFSRSKQSSRKRPLAVLN